MKKYKHPLFKDLEKRVLGKRKFIQVISGPRQVGKTTLIRQLLSEVAIDSTYLSADTFEGDGAAWIQKHWDSVRLKCGAGKNYLIAIDEIQRIPGWSMQVKRLWDEDAYKGIRIKLIVSGSSGLLLQKGSNESLAGRFEMNYMTHWSFTEMNEAFGWSPEQYVWFGGYPGSAELTREELRWKRYISDSLAEASISKDILMLTRIDKPALMRRLYDLGCLYSGQILSYNKILGQLQDAGNTVTLAHYLELLDSAGLLAGIEKFSGNIIRQRSSSPKFMVRNSALLSSRLEESYATIRKKPEIWGRLVESSVGAHLINNSKKHGYSVYYWRHGNDEIDFVLQKNERITGIEVKSGNSMKRSGMEAFRKTFNPKRLLLVGEKGIKWQEFLKINPDDLF